MSTLPNDDRDTLNEQCDGLAAATIIPVEWRGSLAPGVGVLVLHHNTIDAEVISQPPPAFACTCTHGFHFEMMIQAGTSWTLGN